MKRVALVTGANRGIGRAIASGLAAEGIHVIVGARQLPKAEKAVAAIRSADGSAEAIALDVTDAASRVAAIADIEDKHGRLDILVNNAGVALDKWVTTQNLDLDVLRQTMETNVYAPLALCQLAIPLMQRNNYGRIVNISSELGSLSECEMGSTAAYRTSKTALNMMTRLLAQELGESKEILVNAAAPGWVKTELGGMDAPLTPEQGADTAIWLATLATDGPNGGFFRERKSYPW